MLSPCLCVRLSFCLSFCLYFFIIFSVFVFVFASATDDDVSLSYWESGIVVGHALPDVCRIKTKKWRPPYRASRIRAKQSISSSWEIRNASKVKNKMKDCQPEAMRITATSRSVTTKGVFSALSSTWIWQKWASKCASVHVLSSHDPLSIPLCRFWTIVTWTKVTWAIVTWAIVTWAIVISTIVNSNLENVVAWAKKPVQLTQDRPLGSKCVEWNCWH